MRNLILLLLGSCALVLPLAAGCALGEEYDANSSPFHNDCTIDSTTLDVYTFSVGSNEKVEWKVAVSDGLAIDVYVIDAKDVSKALAGENFQAYKYESKENTRACSNSKTSSGDYALLVGTTGYTKGNSTYSIDLTKKPKTAAEVAANYLLYAAVGLVMVVVILLLIFRVRRMVKFIRQMPRPAKPLPKDAMSPGQAMPMVMPPPMGNQPPPIGYQFPPPPQR